MSCTVRPDMPEISSMPYLPEASIRRAVAISLVKSDSALLFFTNARNAFYHGDVALCKHTDDGVLAPHKPWLALQARYLIKGKARRFGNLSGRYSFLKQVPCYDLAFAAAPLFSPRFSAA